jgi:hypothetical protein
MNIVTKFNPENHLECSLECRVPNHVAKQNQKEMELLIWEELEKKVEPLCFLDIKSSSIEDKETVFIGSAILEPKLESTEPMSTEEILARLKTVEIPKAVYITAEQVDREIRIVKEGLRLDPSNLVLSENIDPIICEFDILEMVNVQMPQMKMYVEPCTEENVSLKEFLINKRVKETYIVPPDNQEWTILRKMTAMPVSEDQIARYLELQSMAEVREHFRLKLRKRGILEYIDNLNEESSKFLSITLSERYVDYHVNYNLSLNYDKYKKNPNKQPSSKEEFTELYGDPDKMTEPEIKACMLKYKEYTMPKELFYKKNYDKLRKEVEPYFKKIQVFRSIARLLGLKLNQRYLEEAMKKDEIPVANANLRYMKTNDLLMGTMCDRFIELHDEGVSNVN